MCIKYSAFCNLKLIEYHVNNRFDDDCAHYTIHLVCKIHQPQPPAASAAVSSQAASNDNSDGLRRRNVHVPDQDNIQAFTRQPTALQTTNTPADEDQLESIHRSLQQLISQTPNLSADELAVYHQLYMQYISLNTQFLQQQGSLAAVPVIEGNANGNIDNVNNDNREMLPVNAAGVENNAAAAAGVDPLEYAYSILRVAILFCIMYTHSSFFRLLFVLIALAAVYFFRNRQPADDNRQDNNENTNGDEITNTGAAPENAGNDGDESTAVADQGAETADPEGIQQEQEEPKPNILSVAFTFVSTLVSSILPDNPTNLIQ